MGRWCNYPWGYLLTGVVGFVFGALLLYVMENLLSAPNPSTLYYRQMQLLFVALVICVISVILFAGGLWGLVSRRLSKR
ncbi:MAG: hypothetical protein DDG60_06680 [Anaerolineae bacterium]|nr:MAG: hypothetical protein DDG60_06680 [Anaerolineae bacterium]